MRRAFEEPESCSPPLISRVEINQLLMRSRPRKNGRAATIFAAPKGFGVTRTLEQLKASLRTERSARSTPTVITVSDLSLVGSCSPVQVLIRLRNSFLESLDTSVNFTRAEQYFFIFDLVARIAWCRERPEMAEMQPSLFRTRAFRKLKTFGKLAKSFLFLEAVDATGDLLGADQLVEWALGEAGNKALEKMIERADSDLFRSKFRERLLQEIQKGEHGRREDLDEFLALLLFEAIHNSANLHINQQSGKYSLNKNKISRVLIIIDAADNFDYDSISFFGQRIINSLSHIVREFCSTDFASVVLAGQMHQLNSCFPKWQELIGHEHVGARLGLSAFSRVQVANSLAHALGNENLSIKKVLLAVSDDHPEAAVHPSAYAVAYQHIENLPNDLTQIRNARRLIWSAGCGPYTYDELQDCGQNLLGSDVSKTVVKSVWENAFWTRPCGNGCRAPTWQLSAAADLIGDRHL